MNVKALLLTEWIYLILNALLATPFMEEDNLSPTHCQRSDQFFISSDTESQDTRF